jgi:hypothetical protein
VRAVVCHPKFTQPLFLSLIVALDTAETDFVPGSGLLNEKNSELPEFWAAFCPSWPAAMLVQWLRVQPSRPPEAIAHA